MAKEPATLSNVERRVETLEVGMNAANALLAQMEDLRKQLDKYTDVAQKVEQLQKDVEAFTKKVDALKTESRQRKTKTTVSND